MTFFLSLILLWTTSLVAEGRIGLSETCKKRVLGKVLEKSLKDPQSGGKRFVEKSWPDIDKVVVSTKGKRTFRYTLDKENSFRELRKNVFLIVINTEQLDRKKKVISGSESSISYEAILTDKTKNCKVRSLKTLEQRRGAF